MRRWRYFFKYSVKSTTGHAHMRHGFLAFCPQLPDWGCHKTRAYFFKLGRQDVRAEYSCCVAHDDSRYSHSPPTLLLTVTYLKRKVHMHVHFQIIQQYRKKHMYNLLIWQQINTYCYIKQSWLHAICIYGTRKEKRRGISKAGVAFILSSRTPWMPLLI